MVDAFPRLFDFPVITRYTAYEYARWGACTRSCKNNKDESYTVDFETKKKKKRDSIIVRDAKIELHIWQRIFRIGIGKYGGGGRKKEE